MYFFTSIITNTMTINTVDSESRRTSATKMKVGFLSVKIQKGEKWVYMSNRSEIKLGQIESIDCRVKIGAGVDIRRVQ